MTLFVDCSNSEFSLTETSKQNNNAHDGHCESLIQQDRRLFKAQFEERNNLSGILIRNLPEIGEGILVYYPTSNGKMVIHIRCTAQDANCKDSLLLKYDYPQKSSNFFFSTTKGRAGAILESLKVNVDSNTKFKSISARKVKKLIRKLDSDLNLNQFKFGLAYLDRFDTSEQQMLENTAEDTSGSEGFLTFLALLGQVIDLKGWQGFSGGLDVSDEQLTGEKAIYRKTGTIEESEIIYHVTPWLPQSSYDEGNNLERKRHFGNDTVVIIYSESLYAFEMGTLLSRQIQVVIFVKFVNRIQKFQVHVYSKRPGLFVEENPFYLDPQKDGPKLSKLITDLERQCYNNPPLIEKLFCMRNFYLNQLVNKHL